MPQRTIRGGKIKSIKSLKSALKKNDGGGFLTRVPAEGSMTVRFLTEPDEWVEFFEHYDDVRKFYPCADDCPGCLVGDRPSKRFLANAVDTTDNKVVPLLLPKSLASSVMKKYDKFSTLLDRDYELTRTGQGLDTEYEAIPESPSKMNLGRFTELDLWAILESQLGDNGDDDDDDDDDDKPVARARKTGARKPAANVARSRDDEDDDEDENERPSIRRKGAPVRKAHPAKKASAARRPLRK